MTIAVNPDGRVVYFDADAASWVPSQVATNPQGDSVAWDGADWKPVQLPKKPAAPPPRQAMGVGEALSDLWQNPPHGGLVDIAQRIGRGVTAPGRALSGEYDYNRITESDIDRGTTPQSRLREDAGNLAGAVTLGSVPRIAVGPQGSLGMGFNRPPVLPSQPAGMNPAELVQTAGRIPTQSGAQLELPRFLADPSRTTQGIAAGLKNIPGAGDSIANAANSTIRNLGDSVGAVAEGFGARNTAVAGGAAKDALEAWIKTGSGKISSRLYDKVDDLINPAVNTELRSTMQVAQSILRERANSRIPGNSLAVNTVLDAVTGGGMNYQGVKGLRSFLGEMTPQEMVATGLKETEVKRLYAALSSDLRETIKNAGGPLALSKFERANNLNKQIAERRDQLSKIIGRSGDASPEAVFARVIAMASDKSTGNIARLGMARKAMGPDAWNELASAFIDKLGRDTRGEFSIDRFLTAYGSKLSDSGRAMLFKSSGRDSLGRILSDIYTVSKEIDSKLKQYANPSGTGQSTAATAMVMDIIHHPIRALSTLTGGTYIAKMLSEPVSARATADWLKAYSDALKAPSANASARVREAADRLADEIVKRTGQGEKSQLATQLAIIGQAPLSGTPGQPLQ